MKLARTHCYFAVHTLCVREICSAARTRANIASHGTKTPWIVPFDPVCHRGWWPARPSWFITGCLRPPVIGLFRQRLVSASTISAKPVQQRLALCPAGMNQLSASRRSIKTQGISSITNLTSDRLTSASISRTRLGYADKLIPCSLIEPQTWLQPKILIDKIVSLSVTLSHQIALGNFSEENSIVSSRPSHRMLGIASKRLISTGCDLFFASSSEISVSGRVICKGSPCYDTSIHRYIVSRGETIFDMVTMSKRCIHS